MLADLLTLSQAAATLGVTRQRLYRMMRSGLLPYRQVGDRRLFDPAGIARLDRKGWFGRGRGRGAKRESPAK